MLLPALLRCLANFRQRGKVGLSLRAQLIWRMEGQDGESDKYHGFIVMHYKSMLEKQPPPRHCMSDFPVILLMNSKVWAWNLGQRLIRVTSPSYRCTFLPYVTPSCYFTHTVQQVQSSDTGGETHTHTCTKLAGHTHLPLASGSGGSAFWVWRSWSRWGGGRGAPCAAWETGGRWEQQRVRAGMRLGGQVGAGGGTLTGT